MPQLRWTLLFLGVVFIGVLVWFERRRQRQVSGADNEQRTTDGEPGVDGSSNRVFREPTLNLPEMRAREPSPPHDLPVVEIEEDNFKARLSPSEGTPVSAATAKRSLPVMDSGPVAPRERVADAPMSAGDAFGGRSVDVPAGLAVDATPLVVDEMVGEDAIDGAGLTDVEPLDETPAVIAEGEFVSEPPLGVDGGSAEERFEIADAEGVSAARVVEQPEFIVPDVVVVEEPIVEWPPDELRRVVALRLVAPAAERLAGRTLRLALAAEGFVLGKFSIFHKPDDSGRAVLSAASLSKPGTFEMSTMDSQRYGGLSLFAVLPGPKSPALAFDELLSTARNLNERLQGALQDERGGPLTPTRIASLRETVSAEALS
jgi:hypothetical protein